MIGRLPILVVTGMWLIVWPAAAQEELFRCKRPDGGIVFSDHGGPGCRRSEYKAEVQRLQREPSASASAEAAPAPAPASPFGAAPAAPDLSTHPLSTHPFPSARRSVPSLVVRELPPELRAKGVSIPNKGDITIVHLTVSHLPAGNGPMFTADGHFRGEARRAFETAAHAAAKAVQYDPRYLAVELALPVGFTLLQGVQVDGPSAGLAWAVAIVSAMLGDPLRSDVCLSGTMGLDLQVGPVGGLEHKIEGCHMMRNFRELLLPAGQSTFVLKDKGLSHSIKVTEVSTLAEAYQVATGRELRPFP